jgi:hypothetical protein
MGSVQALIINQYLSAMNPLGKRVSTFGMCVPLASSGLMARYDQRSTMPTNVFFLVSKTQALLFTV